MSEPLLDAEQIKRLAGGARRFEAGEKIFLEGDDGDAMYFVLSGRIDIITYGTILENVKSGGVFGEMALIENAPRSAAAIAAEPSDVIAIDRSTFLSLVRDDPSFSLHVMRVLAGRIRRMNDYR